MNGQRIEQCSFTQTRLDQQQGQKDIKTLSICPRKYMSHANESNPLLCNYDGTYLLRGIFTQFPYGCPYPLRPLFCIERKKYSKNLPEFVLVLLKCITHLIIDRNCILFIYTYKKCPNDQFIIGLQCLRFVLLDNYFNTR